MTATVANITPVESLVDRVTSVQNIRMYLENMLDGFGLTENANNVWGEVEKMSAQLATLEQTLEVAMVTATYNKAKVNELDALYVQALSDFERLRVDIEELNTSNVTVHQAVQNVKSDFIGENTLEEIDFLTEAFGWERYEVEELMTLLHLDLASEDATDYDLTCEAVEDFRMDLRALVARTFGREG